MMIDLKLCIFPIRKMLKGFAKILRCSISFSYRVLNRAMEDIPIYTEDMFFSYFDTEEERSIKHNFFQKFNKSESFKDILSKGLSFQIKTLVEICTTFVRELFEIQERLLEAFPNRLDITKKPLIHPFLPPSYSLASLSLSIWENFALEHHIYSIPFIQKTDRSSKIEKHWAHFKSYEEDPSGQDLIHMATSEVYQKRFQTKDGKICSFPDYYNPNKKTVKYFNGCRFHNCEKCRKSFFNPAKKDGLKEVEEKFGLIAKDNIDLVTGGLEITRECEYRLLMKNISSDYVPYPTERLQSRSAYKSGFNEILEHHYKANEETVCELWDVSSLYPYVGKVENFFVDKFFVLTERSIKKRIEITEDDILLDKKSFHGFAHLRVIPPKDLELPYLGMLVNLKKDQISIGKTKEFQHLEKFHTSKTTKSKKMHKLSSEHLVHALCSACGSSQPSTPCKHSDEQRSILTVVSSDEIRYMIKLGYTILRENIFELWVFGESKRKPIFKKYMELMEVEKIKSSKIPNEMIGKEEEYCKKINKELNSQFKLHHQDLKENKVRRTIMKRYIRKPRETFYFFSHTFLQ